MPRNCPVVQRDTVPRATPLEHVERVVSRRHHSCQVAARSQRDGETIIPLQVTVPAESFIGDLHLGCIQMLSEEQQLNTTGYMYMYMHGSILHAFLL